MDRHPRIYADPKNIDNTHAFIEDEQIQHIRKALRLKVGDEVIIFDGSITSYKAIR
jgi:16S rRNA U1498 N3-methylase RsmE